jgi:hypothetical protein
MTDEELRALDAEIAVKVMGWRYLHSDMIRGYDSILKDSEEAERLLPEFRSAESKGRAFIPCTLPCYSSDVAAAHQFVARLAGGVLVRRQNGVWLCTFFEPSREYEAWEETEPLAICKAALKALEASK